MTKTFTRRDFLKLGGMATAALAAGSFLPPQVAKAAREAGLIDPNGDGYIPTMCEMCVWRCGVLAKVKDGKVVKLEGNPEHPHSQGKLCGRGQSGLMNTYDPDRVLYPLIRVGKRGEGKFRRASWEEALDLVAGKMLDIKQKYGPETMLFSSTHNISQPVFENILYGFGSPNYGTQRSLCFNAMIVANLMTFGMEEPGRDYSKIKYLILTGRNLTEAISTSETSALMEIISQGAKVVSIDPRFTKTASKSSEWLPIKPGTDSAFHLAMINVIVTEELYNKTFVENYTSGFEQLAGSIESYTPAWAEKITGISADVITRIAREFSAAGSNALAHNGWRTSNFQNSFQTQRAITILNALVGNWGVTLLPAAGEGAGGLGSIPQPAYPRITSPRLDGVPWKYPFVPLKLGIFQEMRDGALKGDPYQAHGWLISRQNPVLDLPDRAKTLELFGKLDFIATIDIIMNDTSWFSDVVLPEASYLERYDPLNLVGNKVYLRQPVIEPQGEAKSALWIFKELGKRLGLADFFQYSDEKDYINQQLKPLGLTVDQIAMHGYAELPVTDNKSEFEWSTPSGKIEIFSTTLEKGGFPPLPEWQEPLQPKEDEFYLISGKVGLHTQFGTQNNKLLHKYEDTPRIWIHPEAALKRGIRDWDSVEVTSEVGKVILPVWVTPSIRPDCAYMTPGYGHISKGLRTGYAVGASDSVLHVTYTDPVSGSQALTQTLVSIKKV